MESRLDPQYDYLGIEFDNAFWEDVCACCILPPDAAFRETERDWEDADGKPIPAPEGVEGHCITILWRMDEPVEQRQERPRLHAILAAFAHLYSRRVDRSDALRFVLVRFCGKTPYRTDVPPVNFRLWHNAFGFIAGSFLLEEVEGREYEKTLPTALPPCAEGVYEAAALDWCRLVYGQLEFLLDAMVDATAYVALKTTLDEWYSYSHQLTLREEEDSERYRAVERGIHQLPFRRWYPEALRRMPGLNALGLCLVPLESIGRYALLDYRPEEGRRFCYEVVEASCSQPEGRLRLAQEGEEPLPRDAATHLHLLPLSTGEPMPRLVGVKTCHPWYFEEKWLWD